MSKMIIVEGNSNDKDNVRAIMVKGEKGYSAYDLYVQNGGTLTEEEWLDAFLNAENYYNKSETDTKLNKKPYYYNTVADMKSDNSLKQGDMAVTLGYYSVNDGGNATYRIVNDELETDYQEELENGKYASLIIENGEVNARQVGMINEEDIDNSLIFQKVINFCSEKYKLIINGNFTIKNSITIDKPIQIEGRCGSYSNFGLSSIFCNSDDDITYFYFNEGAISCKFENLNIRGNDKGTAIRFSSRDETLTNYRVWKNQFNKCRFIRFGTVLNFYAEGNIADYDYSSEILFFDCKFYNNIVNVEMNNTQSYNINFISTDFESIETSTGFLLNSYGGLNFEGCSIILRGSFVKLSENPTLTPVNSYYGVINISNSRFELFNETIFDYTLTSRNAVTQRHHLNITNSEIYNHSENILIDCNIRGLSANIMNTSFLLSSASNISHIYMRNMEGASEYSKIIINTLTPNALDVPYIIGNYRGWVLINGIVYSSCVASVRGNNKLEYNNKIMLGYSKAGSPTSTSFDVTVSWDYKKFKINITGAFMGNSGSINIKNSDESFNQTFTKLNANLDSSVGEILLPYKENGDTYTITPNNIWGACFFEK